MTAQTAQTRLTRSTCPYCGVGCGVVIESVGQQIVGVKGDPDHPANRGRLCTKGATLAQTAAAPIQRQTRLLQPLQRLQRGGPLTPLGWDAALDMAASKLGAIVREHGPDALGIYVSGQLLTEDYYVFNKLAKGLLGTNNIDTNSRLCMSSAVAGYKLTLGADAPPGCYDDVDHAHTLFIAGSNTAWAHPVLFRRIEDAKARHPGLKIIVADPRRTDTATSADLHLMLQPGTDVALFHGLLHIMLWEGWTDNAYIAAHTSGFDALKALVREYTPDHVASVCSLRKADLFTAARWIAGIAADDTATGGERLPDTVFTGGDSRPRRPTLSLYCQGLNQSSSGTAKNAALINLHLATGQIGHPGAAPFSLTGQPNAMGGREVGGLANLLSAHRDLGQPRPPGRSGRAVGCARRALQARQNRHRNVPGRCRRRNQGPVDCLHQPGAKPARPGHRAPCIGAGRVRGGAGGLPHPCHLRLCRPSAARHHLGRKGRHRHQQRTLHQPGAGSGATARGSRLRYRRFRPCDR